MATLTSQQLKDSYQSLVTIGDSITSDPTSGRLENGKGTALTAVGIGTDSPSAGLHVEQSGTDVSIISRNSNNNASVATSSSLKLGITSTVGTHDGEIKVVEGAVNSNTTRMEFYNEFGGTSYKNMQILGNGDITFYDDTGVTPAFFWDASAESLGIGTTSPSALTHISSSSFNQLTLQRTGTAGAGVNLKMINSDDEVIEINNTGEGDIQFKAGGDERVRIDSSGNVGIGTNSPSEKLAVQSAFTTSASDVFLEINSGHQASGGADVTGEAGILFKQGGSGSVLRNAGAIISGREGNYSADSVADSYLAFETAINGTNTEAMRIDSSNNLLVGTTATPTSSAGNIVIANGTAPTGNATDGVILYAEDVSTSSELKVRDEAGNVTTLSPHNFSLIPDGASEPMAWAYYSERDGKKINVDMLKLARMVESLTGEKLVYEQ